MAEPDIGVGSHLCTLAAAIARTTGPILECGVGWYSTPMIHLMANGKRRVVSLDTTEAWLSKFASYARDWHTFALITAQATEKLSHQHALEAAWEAYGQALKPDVYRDGMIFLDQAPGEARVPMALALRGKAHFIVAHDTDADNPGAGGNYGWKNLEGAFKYAVTVKDVYPWTTVYSDVEEFDLG